MLIGLFSKFQLVSIELLSSAKAVNLADLSQMKDMNLWGVNTANYCSFLHSVRMAESMTQVWFWQQDN